ncbi:MAG: DUF4340 domain-containing protein [Bacteroidales bacterium]|nr:DUF4340 domain-containing protein [Bacteroidales bacterium]HOI33052.1 DUF4340 domain-containing protein [Bacteroidales bacterium]
MSKRKSYVVILVILLASIAIMLVWNNRYLSTLEGEAADFSVFDTASVTKIFLADLDTNSVLLERKAKGWVLNGKYKAHPRKVDQLLTTMYRLRVRNPVSLASHENVVGRMASIGVKVEVYQNTHLINLFDRIKLFPREKRTKVYYVGDVTKDNLGTYMLREGAEKAFVMYLPGFRGFVMTRYTPVEDDWRDHTIFNEKLADIKSVSLEFNEEPYMSFRIDNVGRHSYKLIRTVDQFEVEAYDTLRVLNFLTAFDDVRFEALLTNTLPRKRQDSIISSPFMHRLTLVTHQGDTQQLTTYRKLVYYENLGIPMEAAEEDFDRLYGLLDNGKDLVLMQYFTFDKLLRPVIYYEPGGPDM